MWRNFEAILARLQKSGKRVFVLLPVPELGRDIHKNISLQSRGGADYALGTPVAYLHARNRYINDKFATLTWSDTLIKVDPSASLCDDQQCYAVISGAAMYFDDDHLSLAGARKALAVLEPYLQSGPPPPMRAVSLK
jgi:SGNH domain (fused to AT3 domains)